MIRPTETLFYYEGPQVFEARDSIGGHYVGVLVETGPSQNRFLVAGVEPERLQLFRLGALELRSLLVERAEDSWYLARMGTAREAPLDLELQTTPLPDYPLLPEPGFYLRDRAAGAETVVLIGALKKAAVDTGAWRLATEAGDYSGKIKEGGPSLGGLRLEGHYRFTCFEQTEERQPGSREERMLYLKELAYAHDTTRLIAASKHGGISLILRVNGVPSGMKCIAP